MVILKSNNFIIRFKRYYKHNLFPNIQKNMFNSISPERIKKIQMTPVNEIKILVLDLGTTNTRVRVFDGKHNSILYKSYSTEIIKSSPKCSEIDGNKLWNNVVQLCKSSLNELSLSAEDLTCMGITTQRESFLLWDKISGIPLININTWQDRRAEELCSEINESRLFKEARNIARNATKTNIIDRIALETFILKPNHASLRLYWVLQNNKNIKNLMDEGQVLFGTVESWIVYKLTNGKFHITDIASASITGMFDFTKMNWNYELLDMLGLSKSLFPLISNTHGFLAETHDEVFGHSIPITCIIGDQQASTIGCGCFKEGITKCTFGTGIFMDTFTNGNLLQRSKGPCYPLVGWKNELESLSFVYETRNDFANINVLDMIKEKKFSCLAELEKIATCDDPELADKEKFKISKTEAIVLLDSITFKFYETWKEMLNNLGTEYHIDSIRVDGGLSQSDYLLQNISNILNLKIIRMLDTDSTSKGAYFLSRIGAGINIHPIEFENDIKLGKIFNPDVNKPNNLLEMYKDKFN